MVTTFHLGPRRSNEKWVRDQHILRLKRPLRVSILPLWGEKRIDAHYSYRSAADAKFTYSSVDNFWPLMEYRRFLGSHTHEEHRTSLHKLCYILCVIKWRCASALRKEISDPAPLSSKKQTAWWDRTKGRHFVHACTFFRAMGEPVILNTSALSVSDSCKYVRDCTSHDRPSRFQGLWQEVYLTAKTFQITIFSALARDVPVVAVHSRRHVREEEAVHDQHVSTE